MLGRSAEERIFGYRESGVVSVETDWLFAEEEDIF